MKIIEYKEPFSQSNIFPEYYRHFYPDSSLLFFDIETTGFAAGHSTLYLIGALWYEDDCIRITQWFNDDGYCESELLSSFEAFCKNFTHLVHFNGLGFDLPYLKQKSESLQIPFSIGTRLIQIDILKEIRTYKKIFLLENMKQTSLEKYLEIERKDTYNGRDLINIYQQYVAHPDSRKEELLLLHNHDDLLGMPQISRILNYKAFFEENDILSFQITQEDKKLKFSFSCSPFCSLPKRLSLSAGGMFLNAIEESAQLYIPITEGTLMHYFRDYKNYYYLPKEDMAVHKSVATYVAAENKEKATKDTCYIKKTDAFIPCHTTDRYDLFKTSATSKCSYQTTASLLTASLPEQISYLKASLAFFKHNI
ncbi:MAG: ribonuclease H-like domain-containing protein [Lachnospiraceae bacterium]|nr:ribonuclease H-like domain-containing protein [Lachnospiraceae bacterium]